MTSTPEPARSRYLAFAQRYRRKAWEALAQARDARWVGREFAVADLVQDALWSRRTANHFAALARVPQREPRPHTRPRYPEQLLLPLQQ
jgi:hypothetical protein